MSAYFLCKFLLGLSSDSLPVVGAGCVGGQGQAVGVSWTWRSHVGRNQQVEIALAPCVAEVQPVVAGPVIGGESLGVYVAVVEGEHDDVLEAGHVEALEKGVVEVAAADFAAESGFAEQNVEREVDDERLPGAVAIGLVGEVYCA